MSQGSRSFFFGATLSEIGFILFFALLLFAFFQKEADSKIIKQEQEQNLDLKQELAIKEKALEAANSLSNLSPEQQDRFFDELVPIAELTVKNQILETENEGLQSQLEELSEVKQKLEEIAAKNELPEDEIKEALRLKETLEDAIDGDSNEISPKILSDALKFAEAVEQFNRNSEMPIPDDKALLAKLKAAETVGANQRKIDDLEGRVIYLTERLGGLDLPPCWPKKDNGKPEYLFNIEIMDDGLVISRAAPDNRMQEYRDLENTTELTSGLVDLASFQILARPIFRLSDSLRCRYFVSITDRSENSYKKSMWAIEDYFYKYVNRF